MVLAKKRMEASMLNNVDHALFALAHDIPGTQFTYTTSAPAREGEHALLCHCPGSFGTKYVEEMSGDQCIAEGAFCKIVTFRGGEVVDSWIGNNEYVTPEVMLGNLSTYESGINLGKRLGANLVSEATKRFITTLNGE